MPEHDTPQPKAETYLVKVILPVMGSRFRPKESRDFLASRVMGDKAYLKDDPENEYDRNAIKICAVENQRSGQPIEHFVGFIPKERCAIIHQFEAELKGVVFQHQMSNRVELTFEVDSASAARELDRELNEDHAFSNEHLADNAKAQREADQEAARQLEQDERFDTNDEDKFGHEEV